MTVRSRAAVILGVAALMSFAVGDPASAHTATDVVAVPAGSTATVTLRPTHGCAGSPTITVAVRAPVAGAVAEAVEGWSESSTPEGENFTVLEWVGGVLPAEEPGAFPVEFVVPDSVGELLLFPSVQGCEDGSELAWISGDPAAEYPAPRLLVLPTGSEPAATIDDVPLDAPGRDQLTAIVDIDNPSGAETTIAPVESAAPITEPPTSQAATPSSAVEVTTTPATIEPTTTDAATSDPELSVAESVPDATDDDGSSPTPWIIGGAVLVAIAGGAFLGARRRSHPTT